jgi:translation elongation factor EF-Ts
MQGRRSVAARINIYSHCAYLIGLVFKVARQNLESEAKRRIDRMVHHREQRQSNQVLAHVAARVRALHNRRRLHAGIQTYRLRMESKALIQRLVVHALTEQVQEHEHVGLKHDHVLDGVVHLPMAQLVAQNGSDAGGVHLLNQRVVDDDSFVVEESVKVAGATARLVSTLNMHTCTRYICAIHNQVKARDHTRWSGQNV